ncbi:exonuclease domain-containing protein [Alteromonas flava]|uniref:exonuclease domain-containing protein n=1 Tax=Alteromonas flava TaxID=2048003 RepID=UPI000C2954D5|nr:exonuclease domain-containing protein [Alteromonas flava]
MKQLPTFYYLDNFKECLAYIAGPCKHLLAPEQEQWLAYFDDLPNNSQCVVARLANRKHPLITRDSLYYPEIANNDEAISHVAELNWLRSIEASDISSILPLLTKADLVGMLREQGIRCPSAYSKQQLLELAEQQLSPQRATQSNITKRYWLRNFDVTLAYFMFLFFGHTHGTMTQFSMRDLGIMRTRKDSRNTQSHFANHAEAQSAFYYAQLRDEVKNSISSMALRIELAALPEAFGHLAQRYRDEVLWLLGKAFLATDRPYAMNLLRASQLDTAQEKWIRETYKDGDKAQVQQQLEQMLNDPPSDELLVFAKDFLALKFKQKRTSRLTDLLQQTTSVLPIDEIYMGHVERGVVDYYQRHGELALRTENRLWLTLFGLSFWDIIYADDPQSLSNEFDIRPKVLVENRLYQDHAEKIEKLLNDWQEPATFHQHLVATSARNYGKVNSLFQWHARLLEPLKLLLEHAKPAQYLSLLRSMAKDYSSLKDGFPDLMVITDEQLRFEEVKAPGDSLRRNQLVSINRLSECGFEVRITKVEWCRDPMQPYVVVDIETTGGQSRLHRITEIGAVKRINGETVATWQSLINPQRRIPTNITALTGIDDDMVAEAPAFAEIAEDFAAFTDGCIFVAHNVNFDYGFIRQEYERLGATYRRPKFCTCAEMRKVHPGLKSYSLASLTSHFEIKMQRHHRAMSDAEAAAELLAIIHELRDQAQLS